MDDLIRISNALADHGRVRLLAACFDGERCVCQLVALLGLSNASVSKHLSMLRDAGLLESRKEGRWVHYRVPASPSVVAGEALAWVRRHVVEADGVAVQIASDRAQMEQILAVDPVALCRVLRDGGDVVSAVRAGGPAKECC